MSWTLRPDELARLAAMKRGVRSAGPVLRPRDRSPAPGPRPDGRAPDGDFDLGYMSGLVAGAAAAHRLDEDAAAAKIDAGDDDGPSGDDTW